MQRSTVFLALAVFSLSAASMRADTLAVDLGKLAADNFAVLGASTVTNTNTPTVLSGNLGVYPGSSITHFPPGIVVNGTNDGNNAAAATGHSDATTAFGDLAGLSSPYPLLGADPSGSTLTPGVYKFSTSPDLTGVLTLNFLGLSDQNFVFQIAASDTLTTESGSSVIIEGAGAHDNVYWEVGSSATLGTTTSFVGNIIASTSITLATGATINCGSAIALTGAVTLDDNTISTCTAGAVRGTGGGVVNTTPEPGTFGLLATGILGVAGAIRRRLSA